MESRAIPRTICSVATAVDNNPIILQRSCFNSVIAMFRIERFVVMCLKIDIKTIFVFFFLSTLTLRGLTAKPSVYLTNTVKPRQDGTLARRKPRKHGQFFFFFSIKYIINSSRQDGNLTRPETDTFSYHIWLKSPARYNMENQTVITKLERPVDFIFVLSIPID